MYLLILGHGFQTRITILFIHVLPSIYSINLYTNFMTLYYELLMTEHKRNKNNSVNISE